MKAVFWDWNGTLVNDAALNWQLFNDVIRTRGHEGVSFERYRSIYRHPVREMYEDVGFDLQDHNFEEVADEWHKLYLARKDTASLHHDTHTTLSILAERGVRQSVLSALPDTLLQNAVASYGVGHFFEHVRGLPDLHGRSKVAIGQKLFDDINLSRKQVTIIGDSSHDAEVARALGVGCILISRGLESEQKLHQHGYPVLDSFERLPGLLISGLSPLSLVHPNFLR